MTPMPQQTTDMQIFQLAEGQKALQKQLEYAEERSEEKIAAMSAKITALEDERNKALKWGVGTLGAAVLAMGYWILEKVVGGHIR